MIVFHARGNHQRRERILLYGMFKTKSQQLDLLLLLFPLPYLLISSISQPEVTHFPVCIPPFPEVSDGETSSFGLRLFCVGESQSVGIYCLCLTSHPSLCEGGYGEEEEEKVEEEEGGGCGGLQLLETHTHREEGFHSQPKASNRHIPFLQRGGPLETLAVSMFFRVIPAHSLRDS